MTIETTNAIAMRLGMIANGETDPLREPELTVREKLEAFARTGPDKLADVSNAVNRSGKDHLRLQDGAFGRPDQRASIAEQDG